MVEDSITAQVGFCRVSFIMILIIVVFVSAYFVENVRPLHFLAMRETASTVQKVRNHVDQFIYETREKKTTHRNGNKRFCRIRCGQCHDTKLRLNVLDKH